MPPRISKNDISNPTPLLSPQQAQAAAGMHDVMFSPRRSGGGKPSGGDSGIHLNNNNNNSSSNNPNNNNNNNNANPAINSSNTDDKYLLHHHYNNTHHQSAAAIPPFSAGRFDSSASVAGGPNDPRLMRAKLPPPTLSFRHYQSFVQALQVYRRQVLALAAAGETFARALEELADFVPAAQIRHPHVVGDLDFLIDSTHLISNAHQIYAENLEREFEIPLTENLTEIKARTSVTQSENKIKILELVDRLHVEEKAHGLGKKKQRDMTALQSSLNVRMSLADEIKRLTIENQTIHDTLSHASMSYILETSAAGVRAELQTYETVHEGLKKLGAFSDSPDPHHHHHHHHSQTQRRNRHSNYEHYQQQQYQQQLQLEQQFHQQMQLAQHQPGGLARVQETDEDAWDGRTITKNDSTAHRNASRSRSSKSRSREEYDPDALDLEFVRNALKNLGGD